MCTSMYDPLVLVKQVSYRGYPELFTCKRGLCSQLPQGIKGDKAGWSKKEQQQQRENKTPKQQQKQKKERERWFLTRQLSCRAPHCRMLGMLNTHRISREDQTREIHVSVDIIWLRKSSKLERAGGCKRTQKDALHKPALLLLLTMHLL